LVVKRFDDAVVRFPAPVLIFLTITRGVAAFHGKPRKHFLTRLTNTHCNRIQVASDTREVVH